MLFQRKQNDREKQLAKKEKLFHFPNRIVLQMEISPSESKQTECLLNIFMCAKLMAGVVENLKFK